MLLPICRDNKGWLAFTYSLLLLEYFFYSATPYLLGKTIDALLADSLSVFWWYLGVLIVVLVVGFVRRRLDTRVFRRIWSERCVSSIQKLADQGTEPSVIISRSPLVDRYIGFFESLLPNTIACVADIVTATIAIWCFVPEVAWIVSILSVVAMICPYLFSFTVKKVEVEAQHARENLNNCIVARDWGILPGSYNTLRMKIVKISDLDAYSWGVSDILSIASTIIVIFWVVKDGQTAGMILANLVYVERLFGRAGFLTTFFNYLKQLEVSTHFLTNGNRS